MAGDPGGPRGGGKSPIGLILAEFWLADGAGRMSGREPTGVGRARGEVVVGRGMELPAAGSSGPIPFAFPS